MRNWKRVGGSAVGLLLLLIAAPALAAPTASLVTTAIQDSSTQVAPCAYHFDATGSSATGFSRPFHTLSYQWDFGDPNAGSWERGASARDDTTWSKNYDVGAVTGHVYDEPGDYQVTLTVTDPQGVSDQATANLSCRAPESHFSSSQSYCFADISGNGGGWDGCPAGATRTDTNDFDSALNNVCGTAGNTGRWCSFRRGDTFFQSSRVTLRSNGTTPGLVDTFGSGARPIVRIQGNFSALGTGDKWTFTGFDVRGNSACASDGSCEFAGTSGSNVTIYDVSVDNVLRCFGHGIHGPEDTALVDFDCTLNSRSSGHAPSTVYVSGPRILFMGNNIDGNYSPGSEFNFRYSASTDAGTTSDKTVIAHSRFQRASGQRNPLQIRGEHRYLQIHDNHISTRSAREFIEVCERPGGCENPNSNARDFMFEMNFATIESGASNGQQGLLTFMASDWTARNNILDLQGVVISGGELAICAHRAGFQSNVRGACLNNTVYLDDTGNDRVVVFRGCGTGSGHIAKGNLLYIPNLSGSKTIASGACESEGNLYASSNPFESSPPDRGQTQPSDFKVRNSSAVLDAGADYSGMTDHYVMTDAFRGCRARASSASWDVGAHQFNADSCGAGSIVENPDPPVAPPVDPPAPPTSPAAPVLLL